MWRSEPELDNKPLENILRERRLRWLGHVFRMDHKRIPQQALYWQVPGYKRGPGRPRANWRGVISKDLRKMGFTGRKQRWQLLTDTDGVGVWPNVSSWIRDESRSRSRYVASHLGKLSLPSLRGRLIQYRLAWLGLKRGTFTCVGWQVTLCDPI